MVGLCCLKSLLLPKYCCTSLEKIVNCWVVVIMAKTRIKLKINCLIFLYLIPMLESFINNTLNWLIMGSYWIIWKLYYIKICVWVVNLTELSIQAHLPATINSNIFLFWIFLAKVKLKKNLWFRKFPKII